jgi:prepilin peptidase CpaA
LNPDLLTGSCLAVLIAAAITDVRTRRIPNALTVGGLLLALGGRAVGADGAFAQGLIGAALAMVVALPLFATGGFGGGDAKLLVVLGAFLGPHGFVPAVLAAALAGGVLSVYASIRAGVLLPVLFDTRDLIRTGAGILRGRPMALPAAGAVRIPFGLAIAVGGAFALSIGGGL